MADPDNIIVLDNLLLIVNAHSNRFEYAAVVLCIVAFKIILDVVIYIRRMI